MENPETISLFASRRSEILQMLSDAYSKSVLTKHVPELIAVSKHQSADHILEAIISGQRVFGENQIQESMAKWPAIKQSHPDCELHLIGPLQSNKTADAVALFDVIQSVDREKIARSIASECSKQNKKTRCFIQINTGEEPQKAGIHPLEIEDFIHFCRNEMALNIEGLMCIPPAEDNPAPHFALLHKIASKYHLPELSMGMSGDYEIAAQLGATYVRVGTALFGERRN